MSSSRKFASVTIQPGMQCCEAVAALEGMRILAIHAPPLPVRNCSMPDECRCRFKKHADRREDDAGRRFHYEGMQSAWFAGQQRRKSRGRRSVD